MKTILVTGAAGFIGYHLAEALLSSGQRVIGVDSMSPYYDVRIKRKRLTLLRKYPTFSFYKTSVAKYSSFEKLLKKTKPDEIVHLAAQAGVRYSLVDPWAYADANYVGTLNVFEAAHRMRLPRVVYASSSSVYGSNDEKPFAEHHRTDRQISIYGATKKANESLAHAYHSMYGIELVGLRFFTVYGRWGRPDLALFKFVRRILQNKPIELYNHGNMRRSFTHISDVVDGIVRLLETKPAGTCRIYNLGGAKPTSLARFVELIENNLGVMATKKMVPLQIGDVPETIADTTLARTDFGFVPRMSIEEGIADFVTWFKENRTFLLSLKEPKQ
jgi:UDP-glucuronate 4-epimerase